MNIATGAEETTVSAFSLANELLAASRAEPGRPEGGVGEILERSNLSRAQADEIVTSVRESQLLNARLRRRAVELEALVSTSSELVRLQDVDQVLRRLVERAHELMGTDVTYLSEVEYDNGDLRVRHSAGTVTPGFRDLTVPAGFGLAARVTSTREPAWVARYQTMRDAPHDPAIDSAVEAEGLVSFLGVPLSVGDEVLGALFACNRYGYDYTPDEILLLSAFADHAAAVLHTARVLAERAAAIARAEHAYRELERHHLATELANGIHTELTSAVMSGGTVVDLVATVSRRLGKRVWALDEYGRALDKSGELPSRSAVLDAMRSSQLSGIAESIDARGHRWILVAILGAERVLGAIVAEGGDGNDDASRRTLERAAQVAALVSLKRDAVTGIRSDRRARWLLEVIDGGDPGDDGQDVVLSAPINGCAVIDVRERDVIDAASVAAAAVGDSGIVAHRDHRVIIAWTTSEALDATERVRQILANRLNESGLTAVVCTIISSLSAVGPAVERATADLRFLRPLGIEAATVSSNTLAPYHALSSSEPESVTRFIGDLLGALLSWDERRGTALFETLACFFDEGESRQAVADRLHIHKNTVQQRLDRARVLLNGAWDDSEFRFRVQAAVRLERLSRDLRRTARRQSQG